MRCRGASVCVVPAALTSVVPLWTWVLALLVPASKLTSNSAFVNARVRVESVDTSWTDPAALVSAVVDDTPPQLTFSSTLRTLVAGSSKSSRISTREPGLMVVMVPSK